jgi:hypothetical protein
VGGEAASVDVVYCLLGSSLASEFYKPTFQNTIGSISMGGYPPMKMELIQCSETSAYKIQMPGNYPEDNILHPQHGKSLKTTMLLLTLWLLRSLIRRCIILCRNEVTHLNKFLALMRLLSYGRGCLLGLTSVKRKNLLDSRLPRTNLLSFWVVILREIVD